jgi:hypothetical protein
VKTFNYFHGSSQSEQTSGIYNFTFACVLLLVCDTLKMETTCFSETLVSTYESTRRHNPEQQHRNPHRHENLDLCSVLFVCKAVVTPSAERASYNVHCTHLQSSLVIIPKWSKSVIYCVCFLKNRIIQMFQDSLHSLRNVNTHKTDTVKYISILF